MACAPFGHAVTIQKSSTAPITTKARPALTRAGSQSGTRSRTLPRRGTGRAGSATSRASPLSACEMPASTSAVWSASSRSDGVPAGRAISRRTAASQIRRRPTGSAIQRAGLPGPDPGRLLRRGSQLLRHWLAEQRPPPAEPGRAGRLAQVNRHRAPARQSGEQTVDGRLQHRRVIAQLRGLAERLVDHRVERDDAPDELASHRLGVVEIRLRPPPTCR